jgi:predicted dehydrogenase
MLRVGFIGLGAISHENVLGYLGAPDAKVVAVCALSLRAAEDWLGKYDLVSARAYDDYQEMLANERLDIVEILTPHHLHHSQAVACARARVRAISLQKPMATSLTECDEIIEECNKHSVILKVFENFVFYPVYLRARELIKDGIIGDPISIRIDTFSGTKDGAEWPWCFSPNSWRTNLETSGFGPLVGDDGFHKFSLARWFMDREIQKISAWIEKETPLDAPAFIRAKFKPLHNEDPKYALIDFSYSPRMEIPFNFWLDDFVVIVGTKGIMWINQCSAAGDRAIFRGNQMSASPVFPPIAVFVNGRVSTYLEEMSPSERNWSTSFVNSTRHLLSILRNGGEPIYTGKEGRENTRYLIAAYVSAQENRDVYLDEVTSKAEREGNIRIVDNFCNL